MNGQIWLDNVPTLDKQPDRVLLEAPARLSHTLHGSETVSHGSKPAHLKLFFKHFFNHILDFWVRVAPCEEPVAVKQPMSSQNSVSSSGYFSSKRRRLLCAHGEGPVLRVPLTKENSGKRF
ncbi:hypothetical protein PIB30_009697 [Stylosanthes scabra]|uniref:Uncharacterized protein n=1 Tax=Stylosanthes scabra TaxID=79078 RepID=A0ABU6V3K5_9FABA|nr:hypothetical protein [Stylosanthes scabra]